MKYALVLVAACGDLQGFGGPSTPVATIDVHVQHGIVTRSLDNVRVALVWGMEWLPEPFCVAEAIAPEPGNSAAQAVLAGGCRDPFGFVPLRVEANAPVQPDPADPGALTATIELEDAPAADVLVGDVTARVGYASVVVYADGDGNGTLNVVRPTTISNGPDMGPPNTTPTMQPDEVLGASFYTMTAPDSRVAYREGAFVASAFYPRNPCDGPPDGFSYLSASGMDPNSALMTAALGQIPEELAPSACSVTSLPTNTRIEVGQPPQRGATVLSELACTERASDGSVRYFEPKVDQPDTDGRTAACVHVPFDPNNQIELVLTGKATDACVGINHFILKGCREGPDCGTPDWDHSQAPPAWWPCPLQ